MTNKYLEKIALTLPSISGIKNTIGTAMGKGVQRVDHAIAKQHGIKDLSKTRWQGANSVPNQPGAGINTGKNDVLRKETRTQLRANKHIDKLKGIRDKAELDMHRARGTVAKGALGVGAVGLGAHALLKNKNEYPQGY